MLLDDDTSLARTFLGQFKEKVQTDYFSEAIIKRYWSNMNSRIKTKSYKSKNIQIIWSFEEFRSWWLENRIKIEKIISEKLIPSVDRIDSTKHYQKENCRIIPNHLNSALGKINQLQAQLKPLYSIVEKDRHWLV